MVSFPSWFGYKRTRRTFFPPYHPQYKANLNFNHTSRTSQISTAESLHLQLALSLKMRSIQLITLISTLFTTSALANMSCQCQYKPNNPTYICCYLQIHEGLPNDIEYSASDIKCNSNGNNINSTEFLDCCLTNGSDWGTCFD
ncbi:hypothetical protein PILCRDRAFT_333889 [Piloderma croceum F 1598]|uniref:Hydrophobin n=1 Tax=Piloderma croceum (strain F 1598) TaxID=765440 RepID=A0A0C3G652_PILCF|nr:hypothetical protein PILCRDRAFT_333889 [Piloderma croceum F 1598]